MIAIRTLNPHADREAIASVWDAALGETWPVEPAQLATRAREGVVATHGGELVGFVLTQTLPRAAIMAMAVVPAWQGRGVGSALLAGALELVTTAPSANVRLGGGVDYFWAGVPTNLPVAMSLFGRHGWQLGGRTWDMVMPLEGYRMPDDETARLRASRITCRPAEATDMPGVIAFENAHFPVWTPYYQRALPGDVMLAIDAGGSIAGAVLLDPPRETPILWGPLLGNRAVEVGAVGVDPALQGRGIGSGLMAHTCRHLSEAGYSPCLLRWLGRVSFYGRLGFTVWREYVEGARLVTK